MFKLLTYLLSQGVATTVAPPPQLTQGALSLPKFGKVCLQSECSICIESCPTEAIRLNPNAESTLEIDLGCCIACSACIRECPEGVLLTDSRIDVSVSKRADLIISNKHPLSEQNANSKPISNSNKSIFKKSIACRVVSTGCSACDLELSACSNSIFDMERFGISIVASPRFADVLLVTGPVPKAMHEALRSCYDAMSEPRKVIAVGSCAISGGVHVGGYAEANGIDSILPVDAYIPGCPPHPWSIIRGIQEVMGQAAF